jgi:nucleotide-binding universal stress UspA family protein
MKRILFPTDFSTYADNALHYAAKLAAEAGAELIVMHATDQAVDSITHEEHSTLTSNDLQVIELKSMLKRLKTMVEANEQIKVKTRLYTGETVDRIMWAAEYYNVDLIVMGTLGATGLRTAIFGTNTADVIAKSIYPVLAVPFDYRWKKCKKIVLAVSDDNIEKELFTPAFKIAQLFNAEVNAVVFSQEKALADEVVDHSRTINHFKERVGKHFNTTEITTSHISGRDFHEMVQQYVQKNNSDMLVMVTHRRGFLQNLFKYSMTRQMAFHTRIPLLALHSVR